MSWLPNHEKYPSGTERYGLPGRVTVWTIPAGVDSSVRKLGSGKWHGHVTSNVTRITNEPTVLGRVLEWRIGDWFIRVPKSSAIKGIEES